MKVQSVLFDRKLFNVNTSREWLLRHHMKTIKYDIKDKYIRWRQLDPKLVKNYRTIRITDGVLFVMGN